MTEIEMPSKTEMSLVGLGKRIAEIRIRDEERARATHERFNVFTTLLQANDEVRLHTRFLHCLLDPQGCHDCGPVFLNLFLETLTDSEFSGKDHGGKSVTTKLPPGAGQWTAHKEARWIGGGQLDILLDGGPFGIAIENKIHAYEQPGQLESYARSLSGRYRSAWVLLYLTLDGKESATANGLPYVRISYEHQILEWLERCLRATYRMIPINQAIIQYRQVVRNLTGNTLDAENMKTLVGFIKENPDLLRHQVAITQALVSARQECLNQLAEGIISGLRDAVASVERTNPGGRDYFVPCPGGAIAISPLPSSPLAGLGFRIWVEIFGWSPGILLVGLKIPGGYLKLPTEVRHLLESMRVSMDEAMAGREDWKPSFNDAWPTGWHTLVQDFGPGTLADLAQSGFSSLGDTICANILRHIELLEGAYVAASTPLPSSGV